jgi:hypothetical protein
LDLENAVLFGNQTAVIKSPSHRGLTSKSLKHHKTYIASGWKHLRHRKWFKRLQAALHQEEVPSTTLEALDQDWTASTLPDLPYGTVFTRNSKALTKKDNF